MTEIQGSYDELFTAVPGASAGRPVLAGVRRGGQDKVLGMSVRYGLGYGLLGLTCYGTSSRTLTSGREFMFDSPSQRSEGVYLYRGFVEENPRLPDRSTEPPAASCPDAVSPAVLDLIRRGLGKP